MANETELNIDYEKLRKALVAREYARSALMPLPSSAATTSNIYSASQEELINFARRAGINIEKYRVKEKNIKRK
jgi:hypothetical protein